MSLTRNQTVLVLFIIGSKHNRSFKVTVHVGTDENIEIEIFAEYEYTLNELLVKKSVFQYVQSFARYEEREFF